VKLLIEPDGAALSRAAARLVARRLLVEPTSTLALAAGRTPAGTYRELVALQRAGLVRFKRARCFHLDEYLGVGADDPRGFFHTLRRELTSQVDLPPERFHRLFDAGDSPQARSEAYEALVHQHGLDLTLLGIGANGHIAFNEPGTPWESVTRPVTLAPETIQRAEATFAPDSPPRRALTLGIRTIMRSRRLVLLASGAEKADALARAFQGPITPDLPASILQLHPHLTLVLDEAAAARLERTDGCG